MRLLVLLFSCIVIPQSRSFSLSTLATRTGTSTSVLATAPKPAEAGLERTASHLERLKRQESSRSKMTTNAALNVEALMAEYLRRPANALKAELKKLSQPTKGRKPDLARRLAEYEIGVTTGISSSAIGETEVKDWNPNEERKKGDTEASAGPVETFCGIKLSKAASEALGKANFQIPSPIQDAAIPAQVHGESIIVHAQTGSGKTLAYLLPITEQLWKEYGAGEDEGYGIIMTPTRELAAQVAGKYNFFILYRIA